MKKILLKQALGLVGAMALALYLVNFVHPVFNNGSTTPVVHGCSNLVDSAKC